MEAHEKATADAAFTAEEQISADQEWQWCLVGNIVGENSKVLMLIGGDELISFCTYAEKDDIQPTDLTPWIGFVYTFPEYRGHRHVGKLFQEIEKLAKAENVHDIYISTNHTGLYEKYGCEFYQLMNDMHGEPSRVYRKHIPSTNPR